MKPLLWLVRFWFMLLYIKFRFLLIDVCAPFQRLYISTKTLYLDPICLGIKLLRKGYGKRPRTEIRRVIDRWYRLKLFAGRRRNWKMAAKLQADTGLRINPL